MELFFFFFLDSQKCLTECRRNNLQGTKFDHLYIKSWKTRVNRIFIDKEAFTAITYLGFHLVQTINKYIKMHLKVYCFLARSLFLLADHVH